MDDNRTYTRLVCDKLFKDNIVCLLLDKFVKFYYTLFSHFTKSLKFENVMPINNCVKGEPYNPFKDVEKKTGILG